MSCSAEWMPALSKVKSQSYVWRIENFREQKFTRIHKLQVNDVDVGLCSSSFKMSLAQVGGVTDIDLCLQLTVDFIKSNAELNTRSLGQWLRLSLSTKIAPVSDKCKRMINSRNMCTAWISGRYKERACMLTGDFNFTPSILFTNHEFVLYSDLFDENKGLLCSDSLTIVCEVHVLTDEMNYVDNWLLRPIKPVAHHVENALASDLKRMLDTGQDSDVTLVASDGQEFPAHVSILASRSPVFAAMFRHDTKEQQQKRVIIDDLNSQAVRGLLDFIYTDTLPLVSLLLAQQLLYAAHKYNIPRLKTFCEDAMAAELNTENAAEFLSAADLYSATQLHSAAMRFTVRHLREVKKTQGWKHLQSQSPHLTDEIMDQLADLVTDLTSPE